MVAKTKSAFLFSQSYDNQDQVGRQNIKQATMGNDYRQKSATMEKK